MTTGLDDDAIRIDNCNFNSAFVLNTQAGKDTVDVEEATNDGSGTKFKGAATINLGAEDDRIWFDVTDWFIPDTSTFYGLVTLNGGDGENDDASWVSGLQFNSSKTIVGFET